MIIFHNYAGTNALGSTYILPCWFYHLKGKTGLFNMKFKVTYLRKNKTSRDLRREWLFKTLTSYPCQSSSVEKIIRHLTQGYYTFIDVFTNSLFQTSVLMSYFISHTMFCSYSNIVVLYYYYMLQYTILLDYCYHIIITA